MANYLLKVDIDEHTHIEKSLRKFKRLCEAYGVSKEYRKRKEYQKASVRNKLKLESALSDVLCIIGTITILEVIETGIVQPSGIFNSVLSSFSLAIVVGLFFGFV